MRSFLNRRSSVLLIVIVIATVIWVNAGSLTPPGGPVAPTMKPLPELEPRIAVNNLPGGGTYKHGIVQRGSYYLIADVVSTVSGETGILIATDNVTLDLNGFSVIGTGSGAGSGIKTTSAYTNVAVRNGSVTAWGGAGIDLGLVIDTVQTGLRVIGNAGDGIIVGSSARVIDNLCQSNALSGIKITGSNGYIDANQCIANNKGVEVTGTGGNLIVRNLARGNANGDFVIVTGNNYGEILNDPGSNFIATNPWANFAGCAANQVSCSGSCVSVLTDADHCGSCGTVCPPRANATPSCVNGNCSFFCNAGFADCNSNAADGCEVNLLTNVNNCGACNAPCPAHPNMIASCNNGACTYTCNSGFADCNNNLTDGCEQNIQSNVNNCGGCGVSCPNQPNSTPTCTNGVCMNTCTGQFRDCNGSPMDGCEVNISTSSSNCGACGNVCTAQPASTCGNNGICSGGLCAKWAAGTVCSPSSCSGSTLNLADSCDGTGTCMDGGSVSCSPYMCNGTGTGCLTTCANDSNCVTTHYCSTGSCVAKKPTGQSCTGNNQCISGICSGGFCQ